MADLIEVYLEVYILYCMFFHTHQSKIESLTKWLGLPKSLLSLVPPNGGSFS